MAVRRVNGSGDDVNAAPNQPPPDWGTDEPPSVTVPDQGVKVRRVRLAKVRSVRGANPR